MRGENLSEVVGGKGNNVARALTRLGRTARPVTFFGGDVGARCERLLREQDRLDPLVTESASTTRVILTVRTDGTPNQTAFFDPDPAVTAPRRRAWPGPMPSRTLSAGGVEAITLSGSSPSPATHDLLELIAAAPKAKNADNVFLDTYGPALDSIWGFWPTAIQLNRREASTHLRNPMATEADLLYS